MKRVILSQVGDTIVEVLIASAVISAALGGAYVISTRSLRTGRNAQERVEAIKLGEEQIERLKAYARSQTDFNTDERQNLANFCIGRDGAGLLVTRNNDITTPAYHDDCTEGPDGRYRINITYNDQTPPPGTPRQFGTWSVAVRWERLGGGNDEAIINYQL